MRAPRNLYFIKRIGRPFRRVGSSVMRADQLSTMIKPHLPDIRIRVLPIRAEITPRLALQVAAKAMPKDSAVVFVKSASIGLTVDHLAPFRDRKIQIGLDSIDMPLEDIDYDLFDFYIAASIAGKVELEKKISAAGLNHPVDLLHHHYDPRLGSLDVGARQEFNCGYVGEAKNALIPPEIADDVSIIDVRYSHEFARALPEISQLTLHYAVRPLPPMPSTQFKPFTKGFTAAACDANIVVNRDADDVLNLLGEDYPYLVQAADSDSISQTLDHAKTSFGGPIWKDALDRMRHLKDLVSPEALARNMEVILTRSL